MLTPGGVGASVGDHSLLTHGGVGVSGAGGNPGVKVGVWGGMLTHGGVGAGVVVMVAMVCVAC